jgi:drug/metabolite transporter (DMT)-like permease
VDERREPAPTFAARHAGPILVAAAIFWAGGGLISRAAPISGPGLAFWRCLVGAAIYQAILAVGGVRPSMRHLREAALGGVGFGLSVVFLFIAFKTTTLVSATVIGSLQPLLLGLVTHRTSHRLDRVLWASSAAAVVGTVLVVLGSSDRSGDWSLSGDLFALAAVFANMIYVIGTKRARATQGALEYQASMLWVAAAVVLPIALITTSGALLPEPIAWWSILGLIAVGGTGHLLFSLAQGHLSVAASSAILMTEVLAVAVGAALLFDQPIGPLQLLGMAIVGVAVGVWLARDPGEPEAHATVLESTNT